MSNPKVSVLIPCYNASRWIAETLESVLTQTWENMEVIVADDGSTDNSRDIIRLYEKHGIKLLELRNKGASAARNAALSCSTGEFIQFLDADDLISPEKIAKQMERLKSTPGAIAMCRWGRFRNSPTDLKLDPGPTWADHSPTEWLLANWSTGGGMMFPALWLVPRKLIEQIGGWNESLSLNDDGEFYTRLVAASTQVLFSPEPIAYYRSGISGSLSGLRSRNGWISGLKALESMTNELLQLENSDRTRCSSAVLFQRFAHECFPYAPDLAEDAINHAKKLHKVKVKPDGGRAFRVLLPILGWKLCRRIQVLSGRK